MSKNFAAVRDGLPITVTTGAVAATSLGGDDKLVAAATDVLIDNRGDFDAYIKFGPTDAVVSKATGVRIPAGSLAIYGKGNATHIAVIGDGVTSLTVHLGEGV